MPASVTGRPLLCILGGFSQTSSNAPKGVPIGFELLGRAFDEKGLIEIAKAFVGEATQSFTARKRGE